METPAGDDDWLDWSKAEIIYVSDEAFEELLRELERPPRVIPSLRRLYERRSRLEND